MGKGSRDLARPGLLAAGLLVLLLCVLATASGEGVTWTGFEPDSPASTGDADRPDDEVEQVDDVRDEPASSSDRSGGPTGVLLPGRAFAAAFVVAALLLVLAVLLRLRLSLRTNRPREGRVLSGFDPAAPALAAVEDETALAGALADGLAGLGTGSARNSIVAAWLRLEAAAESERFHRDPADTPTEFVTRVLASYPVDGDAIDRLAALYREARFSEHPLGEPQRDEAAACLGTLLAGLPARSRP